MTEEQDELTQVFARFACMTRQEIAGKLHKGGKGRLSNAAMDEVVKTVSRLEELKSVRSLMDLLRAGAQL